MKPSPRAFFFLTLIACQLALLVPPSNSQQIPQVLVLGPNLTQRPNAIVSAEWSSMVGTSMGIVGPGTAPDGSQYNHFEFQGSGFFVVFWRPSSMMDVSSLYSLSFWFRANRTQYYWVTMNDDAGRRRVYTLYLWADEQDQWSLAEFDIRKPVVEDPGFDPTRVMQVRFQPDSPASNPPSAGNYMDIASPVLDSTSVSFCESPANWRLDLFDPVQSSVTVSPDAVEGQFSILASIVPPPTINQVSVGLSGLHKRISWDLSTKSFLSFFYKDSTPASEAHQYFLVYDSQFRYRIWVFSNAGHPGEWIKVTIPLQQVYFESGPVDLSDIVYLEVGLYDLQQGRNYTFQIDALRVR